jgi:hypothetical protein
MDPKHKEIAENLYQMASFSLAETGIDTALFVLIKGEQSIPIFVPPGTDIDTAEYALMAMNFAGEQNADAVIVVAGMWVVTGLAEEIDTDVRPSQHKSREHYLNLVYMTADGKTFESIVGKVEMDPAGTKFVRHHEWLESVQEFEWLQPWR